MAVLLVMVSIVHSKNKGDNREVIYPSAVRTLKPASKLWQHHNIHCCFLSTTLRQSNLA